MDENDYLNQLKKIKTSLENAPIPDEVTLQHVEKEIRVEEAVQNLKKAGVPVSDLFKNILRWR